ncbi:hypothetical protein BJX76DRAFT_356945 [Aspergillus varians]
MQGQNVPFRVKLPSKPKQRVYHPRRPHRKSREGCAKCKQRRVKCDETRPHCQKCERLGLDCIYEPILPPGCREPKKQGDENALIARLIDRVPAVTPDATAHSLTVRAVTTQIDELLHVRQGMFKGCLGNLDTLRHFQDTITPTIIIAVAIAHLRNALPDANTGLGKYTLVEAYHWQHAIRQYSTELQSPTSPENMDALFSACLLMTVNSFSMESYNPQQSFVFSSNPAESLNWLCVQSGLRHLLARTRPWVQKSMWWEMFMDSRNDLFDDPRLGREGLHRSLADLCGITELSTVENNPYFWPLRMLTPLLALDPSPKTFAQITTFMGRLMPDFYERLIAKDPPALIILSWWLTLMLKVELWWVYNRARSECAAICMYLEDSCDLLVLQLLEFPARACGYMLRCGQWGTALELPPSGFSLGSFGDLSLCHPAPAECPPGD